MFVYNLRLGVKSILRNPIMSALMVVAIALGVGACMTTVTVFYMMDKNPNPEKNDVLYAVQPDSWDPNGSDKSDEPPDQLTYTDAMALMSDKKGLRQTAMTKMNSVIQSQEVDLAPFNEGGRAVFNDFFEMFSTRFLYGAAWADETDRDAGHLVVLNSRLNDRMYAGKDSVGQKIQLSGHTFTIVCVLDNFSPHPKYYDLTNDSFADSAAFFLPFNTVIGKEMNINGTFSCWQDYGPTYRDFLNSSCVWIQYWVELEQASQREEYLQYLNAFMEESRQPQNFPRKLVSKIRNVQEWLDYNQVVGNDAKVQLGLAFMFLMVCLLNTLGLLLAKFLGKSPEIGLRRALGATRRVLFSQHIIESALIGVMGSIGGLALALLGLYAVNKLYSGFERLASMDWLMVLTTVALAIVATILAGLYPTWRACRISPASQLKTQ